MAFAERQLPGDGTMAAVFVCPGCEREMALLTNPMETQLVSGLGVKVGGRTVPQQPFELTLDALAGTRAGAPTESPPAPVHWTEDAGARLGQVPSFVRGMVKRIYTDYAREHGIQTITPAVMDRARSDLGLEGM
ncbi:MAG: PCP reductase family protein [Longimicrobiales bacterium]